MPIKDQIKKIQFSKKIIAPHGSGLTNLIFGNTKNQVVEISPKEKSIDKELIQIYLKYKSISDYKKNDHYFFGADLVNNDHTAYLRTRNLSEKRHIVRQNVKNNPYFKNFIVQEREFKKLITNFGNR